MDDQSTSWEEAKRRHRQRSVRERKEDQQKDSRKGDEAATEVTKIFVMARVTTKKHCRENCVVHTIRDGLLTFFDTVMTMACNPYIVAVVFVRANRCVEDG